VPDLDSAKVGGIVISIPSTKQAFLIQNTTDVFGRETFEINPVPFTLASVPVSQTSTLPIFAQQPAPVFAPETVATREPLLTKADREKIEHELGVFLSKAGAETKKVAGAIEKRVKAFLEERQKKSQEKMEEVVS
jgi:hypothetical protein